MIRAFLAAALAAAAIPAAAQSVPAADFTDMWWNQNESGWGVSFTQHAGSHQVFAVWYTFDPREQAGTGRFRPLWIVMPGGTWTSPSRITGAVYVTDGVPFSQPGSNTRDTPVGTFTFSFSDADNATLEIPGGPTIPLSRVAAAPAAPPADTTAGAAPPAAGPSEGEDEGGGTSLADEMARMAAPFGVATRYEPLNASLESLLAAGWTLTQAAGAAGGFTLLLTNGDSNALCVLVPEQLGLASTALSDCRRLN